MYDSGRFPGFPDLAAFPSAPLVDSGLDWQYPDYLQSVKGFTVAGPLGHHTHISRLLN